MMDGKHNFNDFIQIDVEWARERGKKYEKRQWRVCAYAYKVPHFSTQKCVRSRGRVKKRLDKTRLIRAWAAVGCYWRNTLGLLNIYVCFGLMHVNPNGLCLESENESCIKWFLVCTERFNFLPAMAWISNWWGEWHQSMDVFCCCCSCCCC